MHTGAMTERRNRTMNIDSNASGDAQAANGACKDCKSTQNALAAIGETICAIYNGDVYQWDDMNECWHNMREMCSPELPRSTAVQGGGLLAKILEPIVERRSYPHDGRIGLRQP